MEGTIDILFYVEDPGAANYIAGLPAALEDRGWRTRLLARGHAYPHLLQLAIKTDPVDHLTTARDLLSKLKPRLVVVGTSENPDTFGFDLITEAHDLGTVTIGAVDAYGNADYRFRGRTENSLSYAPAWLAVPDQWTKDAYISLGYPSEHIMVCGHPHYDRVLVASERLKRCDRQALRKSMFPSNYEDAPVIVFVSEVSTGLNPGKYRSRSDYTLKGRGIKMNRTEIVLEEFLDAVAQQLLSCPYLVLRMHPKNTKEELAPFLEYFHQVSDKESALDLVYAADLVVGMNSMLLWEAAIMGRQTLSIVPRATEKESLPTIRAGVTPCVTTREELRVILPDLLGKNFQPAAAGIKQFFNRGSLQKTVAFIESLLADNLKTNPFSKTKTYHG